MILAALFLKEPVTNKKVLGIFCGAIGDLLLILGNGHAAQNGNGNLTGDLLCLTAQCSFAVYLTIFKKHDTKYNSGDLYEMDVHLRHHRHPAFHL